MLSSRYGRENVSRTLKESRFDLLIERYACWVIHHRVLMLCCSLMAVVILAYGARNLTFVDDYRIYFSKDNPQLIAYEALESAFTKNDTILFAVSHASGSVFHPKAMEALGFLTDRSWELPYSHRVDSIVNFQYTYADNDDLVVEGLFESDAEFKLLPFERRTDLALSDSRLVNRLIAPDAQVTGVLVSFQMPEDDSKALNLLVKEVRNLAKQSTEKYEDLEVHIGGVLMVNAAFQEAGQRDAVRLMPFMYLGIIATILVLLRSFKAVMAVALLVTFSIVSALGVAGWSGLYLSISSIAAPTMIMTLAVADTIHILVSMFRFSSEGQSPDKALTQSLKLNFMPVALTSVTTIVGFLTFNFIDVPPFRDFGNISAIGILAAFILSVTFLPAFLVCIKLKPNSSIYLIKGKGMDALASFVLGNRNKLLGVMFVVSVFLLAAIAHNEANNQMVKFFSPEFQFRKDSDFIQENLTGIYPVEYSIPAAGGNGITDPHYLVRLDAFANWLRERPEVKHVNVFSDTVKRLNMNMHGDDEQWNVVPENKELASQYLLLYELSLPYGLDLNDRVNMDKSSTRVIATLGDISTNEIRAFRDASELWLHNNMPDMFGYAVGVSVMFSDIFKRSTETMINGVLVGLLVISAILVVALRSIKHGLISLIPNILPAGLAFGLWGLFVGQVNMGVAMVMTMTLGIVVDDTVHFLSKYLRARREHGLTSSEAVRYAFNTVGHALVMTTFALILGFAIMSQSGFALNADSSLITLIAILLALIVDFLLLPPLLVITDREEKVEREAQ